jgi:hypothetical protein
MIVSYDQLQHPVAVEQTNLYWVDVGVALIRILCELLDAFRLFDGRLFDFIGHLVCHVDYLIMFTVRETFRC